MLRFEFLSYSIATGQVVITPADVIWGRLADLCERLCDVLATEAESEGPHSETPEDAERTL